jgi:DNA-binding NarL/FixJ family response regulator
MAEFPNAKNQVFKVMTAREGKDLTLRVFLVDGSQLIQERIITLLSEIKEIEIIGQTTDAVEAIKSILKLKPDAVILDIYLPRQGGIHVLEYIKKMKPAPMFIILTNHSSAQYRQKCLHAGAEFFFDKSTEVQKVPAVLRQLIQSSRAGG